MKKRTVLLIAVLTCALIIGINVLASASTSPQTQKDLKQAQTIVQGCVTHGNFLTHHGRTKVIACIAPPGHKAAFEACAQKQLVHANLLTKHGRSNFEQALAVCVENNR